MLWTKSWHLMQSCPSLMWKQASGGTHPWVLGNISGDDSQCWLADGGSSGTSIVLWRHLLPFNLSYFSLWHHLTFCSSCTSGTSCWSRFFQVVLQALEFSFGEEFLGCGYCLSAVLKTICIHSALSIAERSLIKEGVLIYHGASSASYVSTWNAF